MTGSDWDNGSARCLGIYLTGGRLRETDSRGRPIDDYTFLVLVNAHHESIPFRLPGIVPGATWQTTFDTNSTTAGGMHDGEYSLQARCIALLHQDALTGERPDSGDGNTGVVEAELADEPAAGDAPEEAPPVT